MIIVSNNDKSRVVEIDLSIFDEVKKYLKKITKKNNSSFSYIDEIGDKIVVIDGKEYVEPTKDDIIAINSDEEFLDEDEAKRLISYA